MNKNTPRIVHMTSAHTPYDVRIFLKMCRSLAREGYDVHLVAPREEPRETETLDGVTIHTIPSRGGRRHRMIVTARETARKAVSLGAKLYHFHDPELLRFARVIQASTGSPVVYDAHEDVRLQILEKTWLPFGSRRLVSRLFGRYEDRVVRELAGVVAATPSIAERFSSHPACETIQNFPLVSELYRSEENSTSPRDYVVFAGAIAPGRGISESIQAMSLIKQGVTLRLAGPFSSYRLEELNGPRVQYLGVLDRRELPGLMGRALAGLVLFSPLPNHINAQPNKLFEYMSAGIPVIASDFPLWRNIIAGNNCGLVVDPMDPVAIARAIDTLAGNPERAKEMGRRGRQAVLDKYNWESEEKKLFAYYRRFV